MGFSGRNIEAEECPQEAFKREISARHANHGNLALCQMASC